MSLKTTKSGFTLIEIMVVITIIAILTGLVMTAVFNARTESRDISRKTDLEQVKLALKLYKEAYGEYPDYPDGTELGVDNAIDSELAPFLTEVKPDMLAGVGSEYGYVYDSDFACGAEVGIVVYARSVENEDFNNVNTECGGSADAGALIIPVSGL